MGLSSGLQRMIEGREPYAGRPGKHRRHHSDDLDPVRRAFRPDGQGIGWLDVDIGIGVLCCCFVLRRLWGSAVGNHQAGSRSRSRY